MVYFALDLVYCLSGRILVKSRWLLNFIYVRVIWKELFTFEILVLRLFSSTPRGYTKFCIKVFDTIERTCVKFGLNRSKGF